MSATSNESSGSLTAIFWARVRRRARVIRDWQSGLLALGSIAVGLLLMIVAFLVMREVRKLDTRTTE